MECLCTAAFISDRLGLSIGVKSDPVYAVFFFSVNASSQFPMVIYSSSTSYAFFLLLYNLIAFLFCGSIFALGYVAGVLSCWGLFRCLLCK